MKAIRLRLVLGALFVIVVVGGLFLSARLLGSNSATPIQTPNVTANQYIDSVIQQWHGFGDPTIINVSQPNSQDFHKAWVFAGDRIIVFQKLDADQFQFEIFDHAVIGRQPLALLELPYTVYVYGNSKPGMADQASTPSQFQSDVCAGYKAIKADYVHTAALEPPPTILMQVYENWMPSDSWQRHCGIPNTH